MTNKREKQVDLQYFRKALIKNIIENGIEKLICAWKLWGKFLNTFLIEHEYNLCY